ncbi:MAG: hypothetical protein OD918_09005 [Gammaproteobacteria bacterium]
MSETLSIQDARKLALSSQWPPQPPRSTSRPPGRETDATQSAPRHLGHIQINTISVVTPRMPRHNAAITP